MKRRKRVKDYSTQMYKCPICEHVYPDVESAIKCEERGKLLEEYKTSLKPWKWYLLSAKDCNYQPKLFIFKIDHKYDNMSGTSCLRKKVSLGSYHSNDYYQVPNTYNIVEILSPMEAYDKHGLLINFDQGDFRMPPRSGMPLDVAQELDEVFKKAKEKKKSLLMKKFSKERLAEIIIGKENEVFDNFSFVDKVKAEEEKNGKPNLVEDKVVL